jgi:para-nitrobenzyl esterase
MPRLRPIAFFSAALPLAAARHQPVRVESGLLSGIAGSNAAVTVFKGIPFAAPPVGDLRWRPPQPAAKWEGVRQAGRFSAACMQTPYLVGFLYRFAPEALSEDCGALWSWETRSRGGRCLTRPRSISSTPGSPAGNLVRRRFYIWRSASACAPQASKSYGR